MSRSLQSPDPHIRVLQSDADLVAAANLFRAAMVGFGPMTGQAAGAITKLLEPGRTLGAFVDGRLVGTTDSAASWLSVPGGALVSHAAVTHVGVLPGFTRRGVATDLMKHQLRDLHERGEVVATLRASRATIYERFGYGVASMSQSVELLTARATLRPGVFRGEHVRLLEADAAWDVLPPIYAAAHPCRPGAIGRPAVWWQNQQMRSAAPTTAQHVAVYGHPGAETGFARYRAVDSEGWFVSDNRTIVVDDFVASTSQAHTSLVGFLLDLDIVDRIVFTSLATDDPLPWLLTDRRAARVTGVRDETWLRVLDVEAALRRRAYTGGHRIAVEVRDPLLSANSAVYDISASGVQRTGRDPELTIDVSTLGALLLGGASWATLAAAGDIDVDVPTALERADELFTTSVAPHAGFSF
jgi:predicted acetyltransferase